MRELNLWESVEIIFDLNAYAIIKIVVRTVLGNQNSGRDMFPPSNYTHGPTASFCFVLSSLFLTVQQPSNLLGKTKYENGFQL